MSNPPAKILLDWLRRAWPDVATLEMSDLTEIKEITDSWAYKEDLPRVIQNPQKFQAEIFLKPGLSASEQLIDVGALIRTFLVQAEYEIVPFPLNIQASLMKKTPPGLIFAARYKDDSFGSTYLVTYYEKSGILLVISNIMPVIVIPD